MAAKWKKRLKLETKVQALSRHASLVRNAASITMPTQQLAKILACNSDARCGLDGCPICMRRFRKQLVREIRRLRLPASGWSRVSVILRDTLVDAGNLHEFDLRNASAAFSKRFQRSPLADAMFVGGWDISFNVFQNVDLGWQIHLYGLINRPKSDVLDKQLCALLDLDPITKRPLLTQPVQEDKFLYAITYSQKSTFSRRSGYLELKRLKRDGTPRRNVIDLPLRPAQMIEVTSWLAEHPVGSRLILRGLKRVSSPKAKLRVTRLKPNFVDQVQRVGEVTGQDHHSDGLKPSAGSTS